MSRFVENLKEVEANIARYQRWVPGSAGMMARIGRTTAWYGVKTDEGWIFGPSKVIAYGDIKDSEDYLSSYLQRDGTDTEIVLRQWYREIGPSDSEYEEARSALELFAAQFSRRLKKTARINLPISVSDDDPARSSPLVDLMVQVASDLRPADLKALVRRLKAL